MRGQRKTGKEAPGWRRYATRYKGKSRFLVAWLLGMTTSIKSTKAAAKRRKAAAGTPALRRASGRAKREATGYTSPRWAQHAAPCEGKSKAESGANPGQKTKTQAKPNPHPSQTTLRMGHPPTLVGPYEDKGEKSPPVAKNASFLRQERKNEAPEKAKTKAIAKGRKPQ